MLLNGQLFNTIDHFLLNLLSMDDALSLHLDFLSLILIQLCLPHMNLLVVRISEYGLTLIFSVEAVEREVHLKNLLFVLAKFICTR